MLREKIIRIIGACTVAAVIVSGCGGNGASNTRNTSNASKKSEYSTETKGNSVIEGPSETKILSMNSKHSNMVSTDEGMYRISYKELSDGSTGYAIYYVDYASAQEIVLCSDASCEHDSTDCMGIIQDDSLFSPSLFIYGNKLYVFNTYDDSGATVTVMGDSDAFSSVSQGACLYQMNLDGTDRERIFDFPEDVTIDENVFEWNGQLVFCEKNIKEEKNEDGTIHFSGVDRKLVSLDVESKKLTELVDFPQNLSVDGTYKDYLVCQKTLYPDGYNDDNTSNMDFDEWRDLMDETSEAYILFDIKTGKETEICALPNKELNDCMVIDGKMYIYDGTPTVKCVDIDTLETSEIVMKDNRPYSFVENLGDRIYCWPEGKSDEMYFWDPKTNDMTRADIKIKGTDLMAELCVFNKDIIIAVCEGEYKKSEIYENQYDEISNTYGIIRKADIYDGKTDYTPVKMCSDGIDQ